MYIWGKGRAAGRVESDILLAIVGRVGSGLRFAGSGRVQESDPWTTLHHMRYALVPITESSPRADNKFGRNFIIHMLYKFKIVLDFVDNNDIVKFMHALTIAIHLYLRISILMFYIIRLRLSNVH